MKQVLKGKLDLTRAFLMLLFLLWMITVCIAACISVLGRLDFSVVVLLVLLPIIAIAAIIAGVLATLLVLAMLDKIPSTKREVFGGEEYVLEEY